MSDLESDIRGEGWMEPFYFSGKDGFLADNGTEFVEIGVRSMRTRLTEIDLGGLTVEQALVQIENQRYVTYRGPAAGSDKGLIVTSEGVKLLVTQSPTVIKAQPGDYPTIRSFLDNMLGAEQLVYFMGWLKCSRVAMLKRKHAPGHFLGLAGPKGTAKTQLIHLIIVPSMGSRSASCAKYFGGANFNAELLRAEVLVIDDDDFSSKAASRQRVKQLVKSLLFSSAPQFEGKYKEPFSYRTVTRIVGACNLDEGDLRAFPLVDSGTDDKLMFLMCSPAFDKEPTDEEFEEWKRKIAAELPAFLFDVERFEIPEPLQASRGMIKAFRHPEIMRLISEQEGWRSLMELVNLLDSYDDPATGALLFERPWRGGASKLASLLLQCPATRDMARPLIGTYTPKCGILLTEAAGHPESGVSVVGKHSDTNSYEIVKVEKPEERDPF